ncbi:MAG: hypothetical protein RLZZ528_1958 [Pseudomonadota bacterium]
MRRGFFLVLCLALLCLGVSRPASAQSSLSPGYAAGDAGLTPSERIGKEIWFFATAFNDRFFTYSYPQRLGAAIDWYRVLGAPFRDDLFQAWGAIPDPDCCMPGDPDCPAQSLDDTFGFPYCPGDDQLLAFVGREGYRDPACDAAEGLFSASTLTEEQLQRQDACDLRYGTSTGALGIRKFPNPRFDRDAWVRLNGSAGTWDGYRRMLSPDPTDPDGRATKLFDAAVEPPFRIGLACGACHIAYDPLNPPADPDHPGWDNIDGLVGNQYSRVSNLLASGMPTSSLEWQLIARARPGIVDTSALAMDHVSNPGTMNAIINYLRRPTFEHEVLKWRRLDPAAICPAGADPRQCWCEPGKTGKCWERSVRTERTHRILKGGEDDIGILEAIQRVYFNIGSCGEQCWMNHLPDLRMVDPTQRNFGQSPFDIGQCRRDCAAFRAIEDRLGNIADFFFTARPSDLWRARGLPDHQALVAQLEAEAFPGAFAEGRAIFADQCARCHSSQPGPWENADFHATDPADPTLRLDWMGNDALTPVTMVDTARGRALHSNHMPGHVWAEYASADQPDRAALPQIPELLHDAGRGYYRNVSLLSLWAHAPFMHNNAIGPEICGKPSDPAQDHYTSPYVTGDNLPLPDAPACWPYDPSVEGRYALFLASVEELLTPERRIPKLFTLSEDVLYDIAPDIDLGFLRAGLTLRIPAGTTATAINSLRYKDLVQDVVLLHRDDAQLQQKYADRLDPDRFARLRGHLGDLSARLALLAPGDVLDLVTDDTRFIQEFYSNALPAPENEGHYFGATLSERQKQALTVFLSTL